MNSQAARARRLAGGSIHTGSKWQIQLLPTDATEECEGVLREDAYSLHFPCSIHRGFIVSLDIKILHILYH